MLQNVIQVFAFTLTWKSLPEVEILLSSAIKNSQVLSDAVKFV